jgi:steroid 5-alpha reductase family enzyme
MPAVATALVGLAVLLAAATLLWIVSVRREDASLADIAWGPAFALLGWLYTLLQPAVQPRSLWLAAVVTAWSLRLATHIHARHRGEDPRYRALRQEAGPSFWWRSLLTVFWLQGALAWLVAMPLLAVAMYPGSALTWTDLAGGLLVLIGGTVEALADRQLTAFRRVAAPGDVLATGLWRYSRHPNYFGDAVFWWGVYVVAAGVPYGVFTLFAPALMTWLLVRVSGVALLDRTLAARKPGYSDYMAHTSGFVPWPPRRAARARGTVAMAAAVLIGMPVVAQEPVDAPLQAGVLFPPLRGEYLTGREANLPADAAGKAAVILMGFTYASRKPVEAWAERLKPALAAMPDATFYEVPVIGGMARMGKWFIDSGMRRGTPKALHENVITVWGGTKQWKARAGVTDDRDTLAYITLIDREGRIRWRHSGVFDEAAFAALLTELRGLTARQLGEFISRPEDSPAGTAPHTAQ